MEKEKLSRHTFVFLTAEGRNRLLQEFTPLYEGEALERVQTVFGGQTDIPGIVRRGEEGHESELALGFVPCQRMTGGQRLRIPAYVRQDEVHQVLTVYEAAERCFRPRTRCMEAAQLAKKLADEQNVRMGVLGSAGLEILTGLPYTDESSDLDLLLEADSPEKLERFAREMRAAFKGLNMDFEVELPNGYGIKLAELFMDTRTLIGKSLTDVALLERDKINEFLKERLSWQK